MLSTNNNNNNNNLFQDLNFSNKNYSLLQVLILSCVILTVTEIAGRYPTIESCFNVENININNNGSDNNIIDTENLNTNDPNALLSALMDAPTMKSQRRTSTTTTTTATTSNNVNNINDDFVLPNGLNPPHAFVKWEERYNRTNLPLPCYPPDEGIEKGWKRHREPTHVGFLYNKLLKVGSSTAGGLNVRLAIKEAKRQNKYNPSQNFTMCNGRWDHQSAKILDYGNRDRNKSFLWTTLREPTKRAISHFFFFVVSKHKRLLPTDENFSNFLNSTFHSYYLKTLETIPDKRHWLQHPIDSINNIMTEYDFIGISERMEESSVAFMMLLNLNISDVLYLNSKSSGTHDDECDFIWPSFVSPYMKEYLKSEHWQYRIKYDVLLYQMANKSLDLTIDYLGREEFNKNLEKFKLGQAKVKELCHDMKPFPCMNGNFSNKGDCLWKDSGCGNTCIEQASRMLHLGS